MTSGFIRFEEILEEFRKKFDDKFLIFYIPSESDKKVYIVRVIYGGRNIEEELNK